MPIRKRLRTDLTAAMGDGDRGTVTLIRTLIAAIDNAEAIEFDASLPAEVSGCADVPRRTLTPDEIAAVIQSEADELRSAADHFQQLGRDDHAETLRGQARFVDQYRSDPV